VTRPVLYGISDYSPYEGRVIRGWPNIVIVKGRVAFKDGSFVDSTRSASFLRREKTDFWEEKRQFLGLKKEDRYVW
jgi:dihydropyrimidinase